MKHIGVQGASFVLAVLLLPEFSPLLAGAPDGGRAITQDSFLPGFLASSTETARHKRRGPVDVTFTKWVTTFPLMEGVTGGDVAGDFVGEVLQRQVSVNPNLNGIIRLEAIYEVQAGGRSFTALIRGGTDAVTGAAILDGVILAGWRTGAQVHVEFETVSSCAGKPAGPCFEGTIHIERAPEQ